MDLYDFSIRKTGLPEEIVATSRCDEAVSRRQQHKRAMKGFELWFGCAWEWKRSLPFWLVACYRPISPHLSFLQSSNLGQSTRSWDHLVSASLVLRQAHHHTWFSYVDSGDSVDKACKACSSPTELYLSSDGLCFTASLPRRLYCTLQRETLIC